MTKLKDSGKSETLLTEKNITRTDEYLLTKEGSRRNR